MRNILQHRIITASRKQLKPNNHPNYRQHRFKSSITAFSHDEVYEEAIENAINFDTRYNYIHQPQHVPSFLRKLRLPIRPTPVISSSSSSSSPLSSPSPAFFESNDRSMKHISKPPYAMNGIVPSSSHFVMIHDEKMISSLRNAGRIARQTLDKACDIAWSMDVDYQSNQIQNEKQEKRQKNTIITTNDVNDEIHKHLVDAGVYPSPLNYHGFPKSLCSSVNEIICHGIPDGYKMRPGDVASFDISCFHDGVHGDNCATVVVGDYEEDDDNYPNNNNNDDNNMNNNDTHDDDDNEPLYYGALRHKSKRVKENFISADEEAFFITSRRLVQAAQEALDAGVATCKPGSCLSDIGSAISSVVDAYGYGSVQKYRGHGIGEDFHCPPFVKHYRNDDRLELKPGMVFTIEPMITEGKEDCYEWRSDGWTVVTEDGGRAAQFEHMVAITEDGYEILTLP